MTGTSLAWALHRTLARLHEIDPDAAEHLARELAEETGSGAWVDLARDTAPAT